MPVIAAVCRASGVPFVALFDRDARPGQRPSPTNRALNAAIAREAGPGHAIELAPDFEGAVRLPRHDHKPQQAVRHFADLPAAALPASLVRATRLAVELAR